MLAYVQSPNFLYFAVSFNVNIFYFYSNSDLFGAKLSLPQLRVLWPCEIETTKRGIEC